MQTIVIVGASVAGGRAAETLRAEGFEGRIILVGAEDERPYERPPLSKGFLSGAVPDEKVYLRPAEFYEEQRIELLLGVRAVGLSAASRILHLQDGREIAYDRLLVATGAAPRRLSVPGADLEGIVYLRTLEDARRLRGLMGAARRAVVVGAGFIGAEVAASCREAGLEVVLLEMLDVPLERVLGPQIGAVYGEIHRAHGVNLRTNEQVVGFQGSRRVEQVLTAAGGVIDCELAVVGVGVVPECTWLAGAGVAVSGGGVLVDEFCRTNVAEVYAAGDVTAWWHPTLGERLHVEHFDNAQNQGVAAAKSMLGHGEPYAPVPFFWSDQYDLTLQYVGHADMRDEIVVRGQTTGSSWSAFYLRDGLLRAALTVNRPRETWACRQIIGRRAPVSAAQMADETTDLRALARGGPRSAPGG